MLLKKVNNNNSLNTVIIDSYSIDSWAVHKVKDIFRGRKDEAVGLFITEDMQIGGGGFNLYFLLYHFIKE